MLLKLRGMCAVLLAALAFAGCSDDDAASSLATNFDELEFSYEESDQQLLIRSTVPWTLDCTYLTGDGWLAFDKTSGPGDEGIVSQRVTIKALHNTGVERTAELHITGAGFDRKVTVVQEDGQVRIDGVELEGDMAKRTGREDLHRRELFACGGRREADRHADAVGRGLGRPVGGCGRGDARRGQRCGAHGRDGYAHDLRRGALQGRRRTR